jgi:hypothetical protein
MFEVWVNFAFVLMFVATPILLIINEQQDAQLSLQILLVPATLSWITLILNFFLIRNKITKRHNEVKILHFTKSIYKDLRNIGQPIGRLAKHSLAIEKESMRVNFLFALIKSLLCIYFGVIVKVYVFDIIRENYPDLISVDFKWIYASAVSFGPVIIAYAIELFGESIKSQMNLSCKKEMVRNFMHLSVKKSMTDN